MAAPMADVESREQMLEEAASLMDRALQERSWDKVRVAHQKCLAALRWKPEEASTLPLEVRIKTLVGQLLAWRPNEEKAARSTPDEGPEAPRLKKINLYWKNQSQID